MTAPTDVRFAVPNVRLQRRADGSMLLTSDRELGEYPRHLGEVLRRRAAQSPDAVFLAERAGEGWHSVTYAAAAQGADAVAQALLQRGHGPDRPLAALCDASVNLGILKLGTMQAGVPFMPLSPAYSLMTRSFDKLKHVFALTRPSIVYASNLAAFLPALRALELGPDVEVLTDTPAPEFPTATLFGDYLATTPGRAAADAFARIDGDTVAKILLTSGSTGMPKGVINTQRMLCANGKAVDQAWSFLSTHPPVILDWLPWSHTFGTNFNFNQILRHGGTMYIDAGRPAPGRFETTLWNLREIEPTLLYNVPRGFDMLVPALEADPAFARHVFARLDVIFYAGAALPSVLRQRIEALSLRTRGERLPILSSLGSTETAPVATLCHAASTAPSEVGIPIAGTEIKIVPNGGKLEARMRGPNITPGYWRQPEATAAAFDEEGFFCIGDAVKFLDEEQVERGLVFDGRVSENFKLATGTWVHVSNLRLAAISAAAPVVQDAVVTGHDREDAGLLIFPSLEGCRSLCGPAAADAPLETLLGRPEVRQRLIDGLEAHNRDNPGSSTVIARCLLLSTLPMMDASEITDKGYLNQRAVLQNRAADVAALYADRPGEAVVLLRR